MRAVCLIPLCLLFAACRPQLALEVLQPEASRTVTVTGEGELVVVPDIAVVRMAVQARDPELDVARQRAGEVVRRVLKLADSLHIPRAAVQTSQLRVQPEFASQDGVRTLRGYLVHRDISVELEGFSTRNGLIESKLGVLIERAMEAGVNHVSPPDLRAKDMRELHREVLRLAAENARANAAALAETLGAQLGAVRLVTASGEPSAPPARVHYVASRGAGQDEQAYETGRIILRTVLRAEFELQ